MGFLFHRLVSPVRRNPFQGDQPYLLLEIDPVLEQVNRQVAQVADSLLHRRLEPRPDQDSRGGELGVGKLGRKQPLEQLDA